MVNATQSKDLLIEIERAYNQYLLLFNEEINYLKVAKDYPEKEYQQKKEDILNIIIEKLRELTSLTEQSSYEKLEQLGEAVANTRKVAIVMSLSSFVLGIIISIFLTRGIVTPLSAMKHKTQRIAAGDFTGDLNLISPLKLKNWQIPSTGCVII